MSQPRIVVKVGSSSIMDSAGGLSDGALQPLVEQLCDLLSAGYAPVLVTSGAIAAGRARLVGRGGHDITDLQALAAVGQGMLMARYARLFDDCHHAMAQVLFTAHDFGERSAYLNARNALERLLEWGVVPIVNENDTTATEEISLGENDRLAALVATMLKAERLIILTDTPGVFSSDPRLSSEASLIDEVADVDAQLMAVAGESSSDVGTGGMATKVAAARIASWSGVECVIAGAAAPHVLARVLRGEPEGTRIRARPRPLPARKVWIAFGLRSSGSVTADDGAIDALCHGGSLLPVGVRAVTGDFDAGAAIEVVTTRGRLVAKGLASAPASALRGLCGRRSAELPAAAVHHVIHHDDLVVLRTAAASDVAP